jgi:putative transposase
VGWIPIIQISNSYRLLERSLAFVCQKYDAAILGYALMPNHIHLILYFKKENRLSDLMRDFKKFTSIRMRQAIDLHGYNNLLEKIKLNKPERAFQVWNDRFHEIFIESTRFMEQKLNYIHQNPLQEKWQLVKYPEDYPYSSAKFYDTGEQRGVEVTHYQEYF